MRNLCTISMLRYAFLICAALQCHHALRASTEPQVQDPWARFATQLDQTVTPENAQEWIAESLNRLRRGFATSPSDRARAMTSAQLVRQALMIRNEALKKGGRIALDENNNPVDLVECLRYMQEQGPTYTANSNAHWDRAIAQNIRSCFQYGILSPDRIIYTDSRGTWNRLAHLLSNVQYRKFAPMFIENGAHMYDKDSQGTPAISYIINQNIGPNLRPDYLASVLNDIKSSYRDPRDLEKEMNFITPQEFKASVDPRRFTASDVAAVAPLLQAIIAFHTQKINESRALRLVSVRDVSLEKTVRDPQSGRIVPVPSERFTQPPLSNDILSEVASFLNPIASSSFEQSIIQENLENTTDEHREKRPKQK